MYWDWTYFVFVVPFLIISMLAQINVKTTYAKYGKILSRRGYTADQVARRILDKNGLTYVRIVPIAGDLTDHFDPRSNTVSLSQTVYGKSSVAAIGVAAHEVGHAIQHATGYFPIKLRSAIVPITQFGSGLSTPLILIGLLFGFYPLAYVGILLFGTVVLFQLVTLPTEFNASRRALAVLKEEILEVDEVKGARKVLTAAALTYVAALFSALASLLRLLVIVSGNRRNDRR